MNEAIYHALCACFALDPSSAAASVLIREAYQEPEPAPRLSRSANVIYYSMEPDPTGSEAPQMLEMDSPAFATYVPSVSSFSAWKLQVVCYGPDALGNARRIRAFLFLDGAGMPRAILREAGIYPVPDPPEPLLLHEPEGSLWRLRADLTVSLRMSEKQDYAARQSAVVIAPEVNIVISGQ